jgi:hypothetical protein
MRASYRITAPGASWAWTDNGTYTFALEQNQVADTAGNAAAAKALGTITALVPSTGVAGGTRSTALSIGTFDPVKVGVYTGVVEPLNIQRYYKFRLTTTARITATLSNLTDDVNLQLRAGDGRLLKTSGATGTGDETIDRVLNPGTYYLRVYAVGGVGSEFALRVASAVPDRAGNTRAHARKTGTFEAGRASAYTDSVGPADSQDYYRFQLASTSLFTAKLSNLEADANMQLRAVDGGLIATSGRTGTQSEYISRSLSAGTYYLRVYTLGGAETDYTLRMASA